MHESTSAAPAAPPLKKKLTRLRARSFGNNILNRNNGRTLALADIRRLITAAAECVLKHRHLRAAQVPVPPVRRGPGGVQARIILCRIIATTKLFVLLVRVPPVQRGPGRKPISSSTATGSSCKSVPW